MDGGRDSRDTRYQQMAAQFGPALERLARAYERDPDLARDLLQDIHLALWRSLDGFDGRAALRTWVFRVAHNTGATHALRQRRSRPTSRPAWKNWPACPPPTILNKRPTGKRPWTACTTWSAG
ncbi:RNA polymerase sigma factor [Nitrospirillum sp. BR 11163]|uniref:RNA polymerase sigma factor n=1 Tax=Nitrospirillum sp. BR 11163 TaxID=3104323 RepID=UPI002AFEB1F6|nr:RNA polymerase sigma factor [Nitrospirillum sp. BR 11163]MEA1673447.1 RNA polymerase sigma factor [Nitrospirillum sp. BR 11163]